MTEADPHWSEASAWRTVRQGWTPLLATFQAKGVSLEWHDFENRKEIDWGASFHPNSVEVCLNLTGTGVVSTGSEQVRFEGECAGFYTQRAMSLRANRTPGRHRFITIEYSAEFLRRSFCDSLTNLHPLIARVVEGNSAQCEISRVQPLKMEQEQLIQRLRTPPVPEAARPLWFESKALEVAAIFFFQAENGEELFCARQKRLARDRCEQVISLLKTDLCTPPTLEELGKKVGCSHFYLSRTFSKEVGMTIPRYLRKLRMEKAADLLRSGKFNVTEAALEVGYSSPSHFSQAFHETYGCCPGLYGIIPPHGRSL